MIDGGEFDRDKRRAAIIYSEWHDRIKSQITGWSSHWQWLQSRWSNDYDHNRSDLSWLHHEVPKRKTYYFEQQTQIQAKHKAFENNPFTKNSTNSNNWMPLKWITMLSFHETVTFKSANSRPLMTSNRFSNTIGLFLWIVINYCLQLEESLCVV